MSDKISKYLQEELEKRKVKNAKYSIRAFARDLDINPSTLNQVLMNKRGLSHGSFKKVASKLNLESEDYNFERQTQKSDVPSFSKMEKSSTQDYPIFDHWSTLAVLNLARMKNNRSDLKWISNKINISESEARTAVDTLVNRDLIEIKNGQLVKKSVPFLIKETAPTTPLMNYYRKQLEIGLSNLNETNFNDCKIVSTHVILNKSQLENLEKIIGYFLRHVFTKVENTEADELYSVVVGAFLTKNNK